MSFLDNVVLPNGQKASPSLPTQPTTSSSFLNSVVMPSAQAHDTTALATQAAQATQQATQSNSFGSILKNTLTLGGQLTPANIFGGAKEVFNDVKNAVSAPFQPSSYNFGVAAKTSPLVAPKAAIDSFTSSIKDAGNTLANSYATLSDPKSSNLQKGVAVGQDGIALLSGLFSPVTAVLAGATKVPVIGVLAEGVNKFFAALGAGGGAAAEGLVDALPLSDGAKQQIVPLAREAGALAAQIYSGKASGEVVGALKDRTSQILDHVHEDVSKTTPTEGALTAHDTPAIIAARQEMAAVPPTHTIDTPERSALRQQVTDQAYGTGAANKDKRLDIVTGPPASGKSSNVVAPLAKEHGSLITDSDNIKAMLPEFNGGKGSMATHQESANLNFDVMKRAFDAGDNIVYPTVGANAESLGRLIDLAKSKGYDIHLHNVDLAPDITAKRAVSRFNETGRLVDPDYVVNKVGTRPSETHDIIKTNENLSSYTKYDANVEKGQPYPVIERGASESSAQRSSAKPPRVGGIVHGSEVSRGTSKVGKSIEAKAVEANLTKGFDKTAGYDPITIKDQAERATKLVNASLDDARAILRGDKPLPEGLKGTALITAAEERLKAHPDGELAHELANSPLTSATSAAAQEMRLMAERVPDSLTAKFKEIKAAREAALEKRGGVKKAVKKMTDEIQTEIRKNASKRPTWAEFTRELTCNS